MKEFEPSAGFVARVMQAVEAVEVSAGREQPGVLDRLPFPLVRAALAICGAAIGLLNLMRLWFSVFSPAICQ